MPATSPFSTLIFSKSTSLWLESSLCLSGTSQWKPQTSNLITSLGSTTSTSCTMLAPTLSQSGSIYQTKTYTHCSTRSTASTSQVVASSTSLTTLITKQLARSLTTALSRRTSTTWRGLSSAFVRALRHYICSRTENDQTHSPMSKFTVSHDPTSGLSTPKLSHGSSATFPSRFWLRWVRKI